MISLIIIYILAIIYSYTNSLTLWNKYCGAIFFFLLTELISKYSLFLTRDVYALFFDDKYKTWDDPDDIYYIINLISILFSSKWVLIFNIHQTL